MGLASDSLVSCPSSQRFDAPYCEPLAARNVNTGSCHDVQHLGMTGQGGSSQLREKAQA